MRNHVLMGRACRTRLVNNCVRRIPNYHVFCIYERAINNTGHLSSVNQLCRHFLKINEEMFRTMVTWIHAHQYVRNLSNLSSCIAPDSRRLLSSIKAMCILIHTHTTLTHNKPEWERGYNATMISSSVDWLEISLSNIFFAQTYH